MTTEFDPNATGPVVIKKVGGGMARQVLLEKSEDGHLAESGGGDPCFPGDTKILTPAGERRIDGISAADTILSWNKNLNRLVTGSVKTVKVHGASQIVCVDLANGTFLRATKNHTVRATTRWKRIDCLVKGDRVVFANGTSELVERVWHTGEKVAVYNLITNGERSFVANGIVVHNFTTLPRTRTALHKALQAVQHSDFAEYIRSKICLAYACLCSSFVARNRSKLPFSPT